MRRWQKTCFSARRDTARLLPQGCRLIWIARASLRTIYEIAVAIRRAAECWPNLTRGREPGHEFFLALPVRRLSAGGDAAGEAGGALHGSRLQPGKNPAGS